MRRLHRGRAVGRFGTAVVAAAVAVSATACNQSATDPSGTPAPAAPATATITPPPDSAPTSFDSTLAAALPESGVLAVAVTDEVVVTLTAQALVARRLPGLEAAWSVGVDEGSAFTDLRTADEGDSAYLLQAGLVPGEGTRTGTDVLRLTQLDLGTGEVEADATAELPQSSRGSAAAATGRIGGVSEEQRVAVVDVTLGGSAEEDPTAGGRTTVTLDLDGGDVAWSVEDAAVVAVTSLETLLLVGAGSASSSLQGYELDGGEQRWTSLPGITEARLVGTTGLVATLAYDDGSGLGPRVGAVSLPSGRADTPRYVSTTEWLCSPAVDPVAVCSVPSEQRVVAWNLRRQREQWVLPTARRFAPTVTLVDGDDVYGALSEDSGIVLDARTGADGAAVTGPSPDALSVWGGVVLEGGTATWVPRTGSLPDGVRPAPTG